MNDPKLEGKMNSSDGDGKVEEMILKAKMVVKPMASTAYMNGSDSVEEAQEQSIRFLQGKAEAKASKSEDSATDLEIQGQRRKPPYLYRRSCWDSMPWPENRWYKESDKVKFSSVEERELAQAEFLRSLTALISKPQN